MSQHRQDTGTTIKPQMKSKEIHFIILPTRGSLKQHLGRGTHAGMQPLWNSAHARGSPNLLFSGGHTGVVYCYALIFPTAGQNLKHVQ